MFKFNLYSNEYPQGKEIAKVADESTACVLYKHYREVYNNPRFAVTVKPPRQKEMWLCGNYNIQK